MVTLQKPWRLNETKYICGNNLTNGTSSAGKVCKIKSMLSKHQQAPTTNNQHIEVSANITIYINYSVDHAF